MRTVSAGQQRKADRQKGPRRFRRKTDKLIKNKELDAVLAQSAGDKTPLREWMRQQPSMDEDPQTDTLLDDYERFYSLRSILALS